MDWLVVLEAVLVGLALLVLLAGIGLFVRRRLLSGQGGVFDCGMRQISADQSADWTIGMARYHGESFQWFRAFSLRPSPSLELHRDQIHIKAQRPVDEAEALSVYSDDVAIMVQAEPGAIRCELAMSPASFMGLLSWLEAAPPGGTSYHA